MKPETQNDYWNKTQNIGIQDTEIQVSPNRFQKFEHFITRQGSVIGNSSNQVSQDNANP